MAKRPPLPRKKQDGEQEEHQQHFSQEENIGFEIDTGDLSTGLVLLVVIPVAIYFILGAVGYPVKRSTEEGRLRKEQYQARFEKMKREEPPLSKEECKERFELAEEMLNKYVPRYSSLCASDNDVIDKFRFLKCAVKCLKKAELELKKIQESAARSGELHGYVRDVESRLAGIVATRAEMEKANPFPGRPLE